VFAHPELHTRRIPTGEGALSAGGSIGMEGSVADAQRQAERALKARRRSGLLRMVGRVLVSLVLVAAAIGAGLGLFQYMLATRPPVTQAVTPERPRIIDSRMVTPGDVSPVLTLYGQITSGRSVDLRMLVAGEVRAIAPGMSEGGRVRAGEMLVEVDRFEFEGALVRARADLAEAEARLAETDARLKAERDGIARAREQLMISEREVARLTLLATREAASEAQLDQSRLRVSAARGTLETRENQIGILDAQRRREDAVLSRLRFAVAKAERDLENTRLVAPFDAIISNAAADRGRLLAVSDRVASLSDPSRVEVRFTLNDAQYGRLAAAGMIEGRPVTVRWRAGEMVSEKPAIIARVAPTVAANTGGFDVFAVISNPERAAQLRPGAFVEVTAADRVVTAAVSLPASAIHAGDFVFVVGQNNRLQSVKITRVGFDGEAVVVRGDLKSGDVVMTSRLAEAAPGLLVEARR